MPATSTPPSNCKSSSSRWLRFSLRTLLIVTLLFGCLFAWIGNIVIHERRQRFIGAEVEAAGGIVAFDFEGPPTGNRPTPPGPAILRSWFGEYAFAHIEGVYFHGGESAAEVSRQPAVIAHLPRLPKLKQVVLFGPGIRDAQLEDLQHVEQLEHLVLQETPVTAAGLAALQDARFLRHLHLKGRNFDDAVLQPLGDLANLRSLILEETNVTSAVLEPISRLSQLKELHIVACSRCDDDGFEYLSRLPRLESLSLSDVPITIKTLDHLGKCQALRELSVTFAPNLKVDRPISGFEELRFLRLTKCDISATGVLGFAMQPHLDELNFEMTPLTYTAVEAIGKLTNLKFLDLIDTNLRADQLGPLTALSKLRTLHLGPITKEDAAILHKQMPRCNFHLRLPDGRPEGIPAAEGATSP